MRRTAKIIVFLLALASCKEVKEPNQNKTSNVEQVSKEDKVKSIFCETQNFDSPTHQGSLLTKYFKQIKNLEGVQKQAAEKDFFCAFPNSFEEMQQLFGYQNATAAPLYDFSTNEEAYIKNDIYNDIIGYFSGLQSIPKAVYFKKYIKICINGKWEADNITQGFGLWNRILADSEALSIALEKYSDKEIKSVFWFFFDGPHPKNDYNATLYKKLYSVFEKNNEHLANLLTDSYTTLIGADETTTIEEESTVIELDYPYTILNEWLQLGITEEVIISKLGYPEEKGEEQDWEAVGLFMQEWKYISRGIVLQMGSEESGKPKNVEMITLSGLNKMKTTKDIGLGASRGQVLEAYKGMIGSYDSHEGDESKKPIVVGSIYGGIIFTMENDQVSQIFVGAAAE